MVEAGRSCDFHTAPRAVRICHGHGLAADFDIAKIDLDGEVRDVDGLSADGAGRRLLPHGKVRIFTLVLDEESQELFLCGDRHNAIISQGNPECQTKSKEEYAMNAVMTAASNEMPGSEVFAIAKGALDWLRNAPDPFVPTPVEEKRAEVIDMIRGLARDLKDLDFEIRCTEVQIHIALERKKLLDAAVAGIEEQRGAEKNRFVIKGLDASKWRTLRERRKLLREMERLFSEKRGYINQIRTVKGCMTDLNRIKDDRSMLALLVAEADVAMVN
jgi:hypothetical protein